MRMSEWSSDVCSSDLLAPERVGIAAAEESQRLHFVRVGRVDARQRLHVQLVVEAVDEGADELALVKQVQRLRRRIDVLDVRSEEHTSELQSPMRISYAVFCLKKKKYKLLQAQTP